MKYIKISAVVIVAILLYCLTGFLGWTFKIDPSVFFLPSVMIGVCIGFCSVKFIIDIIKGDL